jgi:putative addiction module component (TIGR02574 family)
LKEASLLEASERARLAGLFLESLEPPADSDIEAAWREEILRRSRAVERGDVTSVSWAEVKERNPPCSQARKNWRRPCATSSQSLRESCGWRACRLSKRPFGRV